MPIDVITRYDKTVKYENPYTVVLSRLTKESGVTSHVIPYTVVLSCHGK